MHNPNDITAKLYDLVSTPIKGNDITDEEISLISSITLPKSNILDIGVGTGRHLIPLSELGFNVTGIDSSEGMVNTLDSKLKEKSMNIIREDVLTHNFSNQKFDLIILMWNSFNEIALSTEGAQHLFNVFGNLVNIGGKVLINSDDPETTSMDKIDFELNYSKNNKDYRIHWHTIDFDTENNISTSLEEVTVDGKDELNTEIKQKWYSQDEYEKLGEMSNFKIERFNLKRNTELYLVFTKLS